MIDDVHDHLEDRRYDPRASRASCNQERSSLLQDNGGGHGAQHALIRSYSICLALYKPRGVEPARPEVEIIHLVIEEKPGAFHDDATTEIAVQGECTRYRIAVSVYNRKMGRFIPFIEKSVAMFYLPGWGSPERVNGAAQRLSVSPGGDTLYRNIAELNRHIGKEIGKITFIASATR